MADDAVQNEPDSEAVEETGRGGRLGVTIAVTVAVLLGAVAGVALVGPAAAERFSQPEKAEHAKDDGHGAAPASSYTLESLVLNPADTKGTRFLMVSVVAKMSDSHGVDALAKRDAEIRDRLMSLLGSKTVDELTDVTRRDALKEEIRSALSALTEYEVTAVYLPTFVIQ